jgi:hypothetical protein
MQVDTPAGLAVKRVHALFVTRSMSYAPVPPRRVWLTERPRALWLI